MKKFMLLILVTITANQALAWKTTPDHSKEFTFKYKLAGEQLEIKRQAASYEDAYEQAAQDCFRHFKGSGPLSEDRGLDIIDTCANPRS